MHGAGADLRRARVEDVQAALEAMRSKADGTLVKPATVNMYVATVKSFLGFAHRVGFTRFNAAPLIKLKKAPRQVAQRILGELEVRKLIDAAPSRAAIACCWRWATSEACASPSGKVGAPLGRGQES